VPWQQQLPKQCLVDNALETSRRIEPADLLDIVKPSLLELNLQTRKCEEREHTYACIDLQHKKIREVSRRKFISTAVASNVILGAKTIKG